ncbi:MAG TPA: tetratricopeptide repeat protein [Acidisarcina sp.]
MPDPKEQRLERQFQTAVADYNAGKLPEAAAELEELLPAAPKSFEAHELLGMIYAAQSQDQKALEQLELAVRIKPDAAVARTNLAASFSRLGKFDLADDEFKKALDLAPQEYETNHNLGEFYIQREKIPEAIPFLDHAQQIKPDAYSNGYDLALAYLLVGKLEESRSLVEALVKQNDTGELHDLLAQIEEKEGHFVAAANEYEKAAHMDPSEVNLFDWASELLLHRTYEPAIDVFRQGAVRYPKSARIMIGLGMALYSRGKYDEAIEYLLKAADLDPSDPRCYLFLSKAYSSSPNQAAEVIERFRRFSELQPANAQALYYYAMSLWKGKRTEDSAELQSVEPLLRKVVTLDPKYSEAYLQLGNLYSDRHDYSSAIPQYLRALHLDKNLPDAHYRLGQAYVHTGQKDLAQPEFEIYQRQRAEHLAELDKERAEVQQFVYAAKEVPAAKP